MGHVRVGGVRSRRLLEPAWDRGGGRDGLHHRVAACPLHPAAAAVRVPVDPARRRPGSQPPSGVPVQFLADPFAAEDEGCQHDHAAYPVRVSDTTPTRDLLPLPPARTYKKKKKKKKKYSADTTA